RSSSRKISAIAVRDRGLPAASSNPSIICFSFWLVSLIFTSCLQMNRAKRFALDYFDEGILDQFHDGEKSHHHTQPPFFAHQQGHQGNKALAGQTHQDLRHLLARGQGLTLHLVALEHISAPQ